MQTKRCNVLTVVLNSPLPLKNRSFMLVGDILMNQSDAHLAVKQREPSIITPEVPDLAAKCILQYVLSVAKTVKCPLNLEKADQYIVANVITRIN